MTTFSQGNTTRIKSKLFSEFLAVFHASTMKVTVFHASTLKVTVFHASTMKVTEDASCTGHYIAEGQSTQCD